MQFFAQGGLSGNFWIYLYAWKTATRKAKKEKETDLGETGSENERQM
jgi:hypothetical protein